MNLKVKFLFLTLLTAVLFSCNSSIKYYDLPAKTGENKYNAVIEIPSGTNKKIEFNKESNSFEIDKKNGWLLVKFTAKTNEDKIKVVFGPTDKNQKVPYWEKPNKNLSSVLIDTSSLTTVKVK